MTDAATQNESVFWRMVSALWFLAASVRAWAYRSGLRRQQRLRAPVISVGNITFGGTGKTPFTIWLAEKLHERGYRVAILTRGYRRQSKGVRTYPPGSQRASSVTSPSSSHDGDEVQLYLRHLPHAAVGIAVQRYAAGSLLEKQSRVDVHLLDDGFQHLPLARVCDLVLIDATNPWGARDGLPRALREPVSALRRAHILLLTRCEQVGDTTLDSLEFQLRALRGDAAIFRSETRLAGFRNSLETPLTPVDSFAGRQAVAVCGVGNPESFFALLRAAGITLAATRVFPDHHHYNDQDVDQINDLLRSHSADYLITTEKDVVNLPHPARFADNFIVPAYWAEIALAIPEEEMLVNLLAQNIGPLAGGSGRH
ncbi:MAG: tetraacyldisaccharide 4'-kinase [Acidobacteria bacterium]|nr:tetraacyldisaccharide 4'-kinase [Acidobacteriota bacterium]